MVKGNPFYKYAEENNLLHLIELPVVISGEEKLHDVVELRIKGFIDKLVTPYLREKYSVNNVDSIECFMELKSLGNGILKSLNTGEYEPLKKTLDKINFMGLVPIYELTSKDMLFRSRDGIKSAEKEFYHAPFRKAGRFDIQGCIGWYLGRSKKVCKLEVCKDKKKRTSTRRLHLKPEAQPLRLVDMTSERIHTQKVSDNEHEIALFPLFLACNCLSENKANNKDVYLIPQLLAHYIHENRKKNEYSGDSILYGAQQKARSSKPHV